VCAVGQLEFGDCCMGKPVFQGQCCNSRPFNIPGTEHHVVPAINGLHCRCCGVFHQSLSAFFAPAAHSPTRCMSHTAPHCLTCTHASRSRPAAAAAAQQELLHELSRC
jgi:hypothetical protein